MLTALVAGCSGLTMLAGTPATGAPPEASAALSVSMARVGVGPDSVQPSARAISADGRYVVFGSRAEDLVPGDDNGRSDVFRYDTTDGSIIRLSVGPGGVQGDRDSDNPAISATGRFVAFSSAANLAPGPANGSWDVYLYDAQDGAIVRVSAANNPGQSSNGSGYGGPAISADGRYVVYDSYASNLVPGDTNGAVDVFRYDTQTQTTIRVSVASNGTQANGGSGGRPAISDDGRYIAFSSTAANLVAGDNNNTTDVFRHDTVTGTTIRISRASDGTQGNNWSQNPQISADGRYAVYISTASSLVTNDTNAAVDVFRYDATDGATTRVSSNAFGSQANGESTEASISADGRYVTFGSGATNLVDGDANGAYDIFTKDTQTGAVGRVSISSSGVQGNGDSTNLAASGDGHRVVFSSAATNLVPGDSNGQIDLFVADASGEIEVPDPPGVKTPLLISTSTAGDQANATSGEPVASADGRYVAFRSAANNLVPGDSNGVADIFLRDTVAETTTRVSLSAGGAQANQESYDPFISDDGRYVAFLSNASNLVPGDTNSTNDVFVRDTVAETTVRVSRSSGGTQANGGSSHPSISADGRYVAFFSDATNLVPGDTNGERDVFRYDVVNDSITRVSLTSTGTQANAGSSEPELSADGRYVAYLSNASNLVPGDSNGSQDLFRYDVVLGTVVRIGPSHSPPAISADGRYVAYSDSGSGALRLFDAQTGENRQLVAGTIHSITMSDDARYIGFASASPLGSATDINGKSDVFRLDVEAGTTARMSDAGTGTQANNHSSSPAISPDGEYIAYSSSATNLTRCDANGDAADVFLTSALKLITPPDHSICAMEAPTVTPGDSEVTVRWQRPAVDPGFDVTQYTVTAQPGDHVVTADGGSIETTITGLTNGTAYTVTVVATNAAGDSPPSPPSSQVVPRTTPTAPLDVTATPGNGQLSVSWSAPASDGGAAVTGYVVTTQPGDHVTTVAGDVTHATIPNLDNGTAYTVTVTATNPAGDSPASAPSAAATPRTTPGAPRDVTATPGDGRIDVTWAPPGSDGGAAITGYTVVAQPGDHVTTVDATTTASTITGLTNGTTYTVSVRAANLAGDSPEGYAGGGVTPHAPGAVVAYDSSRSVPADGAAGIELAGLDSSGGVLTYEVTSPPTHGTLSGTAPHLVYRPDAGYTGADSIGWSVSSSYGGSAAATVSIDVRSDGADEVSQTVEPGQTVSTGATVGPDAPSQAAVTSPAGGEVSIAASSGGDPSTPAPAGYGLVGTQYVIEAPDGTAEDPLRFVFLLSVSALPASVDPDLVTVFRNGEAISPCADSSGTATPDPCVASYSRDGDTITIEVLSSHASSWATGVRGALTVTTTTPPISTEGVAMRAYALKATGGKGTLRWSIADGVLPTGMKLTAAGSLSGTPQCATAAVGCPAGTSTFMVQVTDSSVPAKWGLATITVTVKPMSITAPAIKTGRVGVAYPSTRFKAVGGGSPIAWSASGLPAGMKISTTGAVSGRPTVSGTFDVVVTVRNTKATWRTATKVVTIVVSPMAISSTPAVPKVGKVGTAYSLRHRVVGGNGTKSWAVTAGSLPSGLKLNTRSGAVTGTPTVAGTYTFTLTVSDSSTPRNSATATYTIEVEPR